MMAVNMSWTDRLLRSALSAVLVIVGLVMDAWPLLVVAGLILLTVAGNALNLLIPRLVADAIDSYTAGAFVASAVARQLLLTVCGIFVFASLQSLVQAYAAEKVARDLRRRLVERIAEQDHGYVQRVSPAALLTLSASSRALLA